MDADPLSAGGLGRRRGPLDQRRRGRRDRLHRLHRAQDERARDRPADRATGTRLNPVTAPADGEQGELFTAYRYHACFTDSPLQLIQAEAQHRGHAIVEQVIADLKAGPIALCRPGRSPPTAPGWYWPRRHSTSHPPPGSLASLSHGKATTTTVRAQLIAVPARLASSARRLVVHLPRDWPCQNAWERLHTASHAPPPPAT